MAHLCPWWFGYALVNPLRRLVQSPRTVLEPFVKEGMLVLEPGCGMGYFTVELARLVGPSGRVVAVDLQPRMLAGLKRRLRRAGLADRVEPRSASATSLGVDDLAGRVDLALAFYFVHEVPDQARLFEELARALKPPGRVLVAEPPWHVPAASFARSLEAAAGAGLTVVDRPRIGRNRTAVFGRS